MLGIPRENNAKDVDWSKVAKTVTEVAIEKPEAIKIDVSDILSRYKKPTKTKIVEEVVTSSNGECHTAQHYSEHYFYSF